MVASANGGAFPLERTHDLPLERAARRGRTRRARPSSCARQRSAP